MSNVKQVIVMRKDLKMRRGKEIAQGAHASIKWLVERQVQVELDFYKWAQNGMNGKYPQFGTTNAEHSWMHGAFTKVCLQVNSEQELRDIHQAALDAGLESHLIIDAGRTEFNGIPTPTCIAIGPDYEEEIDPITGNLKLY